ncbi:MAG: copper-binding protein [Acidobacteriota bacterium]|nr:copper-binding protein [Blastocatellia bacterium]MDW8412996.1 copper-binding protein [Acidobacteriota bacterium]
MRFFLFLLVFSLAGCGSQLQSNERPKPVVVRKFQARGRVEAVDAKAGKITINHEKIPGYMDAMTMSFTVDPAMIEGLSAGDSVSFVIEDAAGIARIISIQKEMSPQKDSVP